MTERIAGKLLLQAEFRFFDENKLIYGIRGHRQSRVILVGEQETRWSSGMEPVLCQNVQGILRKDSVPVGTCFGMADMGM